MPLDGWPIRILGVGKQTSRVLSKTQRSSLDLDVLSAIRRVAAQLLSGSFMTEGAAPRTRANRTRALWFDRAQRLVGSRRAKGRNAAITALYARWYVEHPQLCKWAGMAVFASYSAGRYLRVLDQTRRVTRHAQGIEAQIELIRRTNDDVFDDIGWTQLAYLSKDGGIRAVREGLADWKATHATLLEGYETIERGRRLLEKDPVAARELVWAGSRLLLKHEQEVSVQPIFTTLQPWFGKLFSVVAASSFDLDRQGFDPTTLTAFYPFMMLRGRDVMRRSGNEQPDVTIFSHRWFWIENDAFVAWQRAEGRPQLMAQMRRFV